MTCAANECRRDRFVHPETSRPQKTKREAKLEKHNYYVV